MQVGDLVDERLGFFGRQLIWMGQRLCGGAAMLAGQVTGLRDFSDGKKRGVVVVERAACRNLMHRLHKASGNHELGIAVCRGFCGRFGSVQTENDFSRCGSFALRRPALSGIDL